MKKQERGHGILDGGRPESGARRALLPWAPTVTLAVLLLPLAAGLAGTIAAAFGYFPALGGNRPSLAPMAELLDWPGLARATGLSLWTGVVATILSLVIALALTAGWQGTPTFRWIERLLAPLLSVPHAAVAVGLAFLIAPSGWISRALSPWATGWQQPPDLLILQDPMGLSLILGLVAKELPFLFLMILAALPQTRSDQAVMISRSLGYGAVTGWIKIVLPAIYRQIRLPVYAVLAYSMSVVDMAMILGPNTPPPLSVQIVRWIYDPDLSHYFLAAAGAMLQFALVLAALGLWWGAETVAGCIGRRWVMAGGRGARSAELGISAVGLGLGAAMALLVLWGLAALFVWSFAGPWTFPDVWPDEVTARTWQRHGPHLASPAAETLLIASAASLIALILTVACLEAEHRHGLQPTTRALWILYLPLLVPQVAFLPGLNILALVGGASGGRSAVVATHVVLVLPYVFLSLGDPWRAWDARHGGIARALGSSRARVLYAVRLPMLLRPILTAAAVGFAVSVSQYLPTLLVGAGRVQTLTTETVALTAGGDRRAIGVFGLMQTLVALGPFLIAIVVPAFVWRNRAGLRHG